MVQDQEVQEDQEDWEGWETYSLEDYLITWEEIQNMPTVAKPKGAQLVEFLK